MGLRARITPICLPARQALLAGLLATTTLTSGLIAPAMAQQQALAFDIPAGPLGRALTAFGSQAGVQISFEASATQGLSTPGVQGTALPEAALAQILQGTGLRFSFIDAQNAVVARPDARITPGAGEVLLDPVTLATGRSGLFAGGMTADTPYESAAAASFADAETIAGKNSGSVINTLRTTPGTFTREVQGGGGVGVNIRGGEGFGRVNAMLDGVRQQNPFLGHYGNGGNVYVMPELVGGLEVNRGSVDGNQGFNSLTGSANFRTLDADDILQPGRRSGGLLRLGWGDNGYNTSKTIAGALRFPDQGLTLVLAHATRDSDNYRSGVHPRYNRKYQRTASAEHPTTSLLKLRWQPNDQHDLQFSATLYDLEAAQAVKNDTFSLKYRYTPGHDLVDLRLHIYRNDYALRLNSGLQVANRASGIELSNVARFSLGGQEISATLGGAFYRDDIRNYSSTGGGFVSGAYVPYGSGVRDTGGIYANLAMTRGIFAANLGLRADYYGLDGLAGPTTPNDPATALRVKRSEWTFTPTARLSAQPLDWLEAYVSYGRSFRAPTVAETLFPGFHGTWNSTFANPALNGEIAQGWEGGVNITRSGLFASDDRLQMKLHYFDNNIKGFIVDGVMQYTNTIGKTRNQGVEIQANYDHRRFFMGLAYSNSKTDNPIAWGTGLSTSYYSKLPETYWTLDGGIKLFGGDFILGARVRHVGKSNYVNGLVGQNLEVAPYTLSDLYASYAPNERTKLWFSVENLNDKFYTPALDTFNPNGTSSVGRGKTFTAGISLRF